MIQRGKIVLGSGSLGERWVLILRSVAERGKLQIPRLRSPGFPVEIRGFDDLHAALFTESRTRGRR
jgi:hypothetical protein